MDDTLLSGDRTDARGPPLTASLTRRDGRFALEIFQALAINPEALDAVGAEARQWLAERVQAYPADYEPTAQVAISWERLEAYLACVRFARVEAEKGRPLAKHIVELLDRLDASPAERARITRAFHELEKKAITAAWPDAVSATVDADRFNAAG